MNELGLNPHGQSTNDSIWHVNYSHSYHSHSYFMEHVCVDNLNLVMEIKWALRNACIGNGEINVYVLDKLLIVNYETTDCDEYGEDFAEELESALENAMEELVARYAAKLLT